MSGLEMRTIGWRETLPLRRDVLWPEENLEFCRVEGDEMASHYGGFID